MKQKLDEQVRLERRRYAYLPDVFVWHGQRYDIRQIERSWTVARGKGAGRMERRYFRVRCDDGTFELYHDLLANTWSVSASHRRAVDLPFPRWEAAARVAGLIG